LASFIFSIAVAVALATACEQFVLEFVAFLIGTQFQQLGNILPMSWVFLASPWPAYPRVAWKAWRV